MRHPQHKYGSTAGTPERPLETFSDVRRALDNHLRKTDSVFRKMSEDGLARHARRVARELAASEMEDSEV